MNFNESNLATVATIATRERLVHACTLIATILVSVITKRTTITTTTATAKTRIKRTVVIFATRKKEEQE